MTTTQPIAQPRREHPAAAIHAALAALADHMRTHGLPTFHTIDGPSRLNTFDGLVVTIYSDHAGAWLARGLAVDDRVYWRDGGRWCHVDGRLADSGVRVRVQWVDAVGRTWAHLHPDALRAVPAGPTGAGVSA